MKEILYQMAILLITTVVSFGQTNVYHPFPDSNAFWGDDGRNIFDGTVCYDTRYGLKGDTTINGMKYTKVYSLVDSTLTNPNSTYFAAIREQDKRIFTVIDTFPEEVLYDFNLGIGDTITYHYSMIFHEPAIFSRVVTQIDSILLYNGTYRKQYTFASGINCSTSDIVVEGIGSIIWTGLFNPLINAIATNGDIFTFECFKQNEIVLYLHNLSCEQCFCTLGTEIKDSPEPENLVISPNPFSTESTLRSATTFKNANLTIYNAYGQQVKRMTNISGTAVTLNRENLPNGLYFLQMIQNNKTPISEKFMLIK